MTCPSTVKLPVQLTCIVCAEGFTRSCAAAVTSLNVLPGVCSVAFVFLPGSQFDFYGFTFVKQEEAAQ